MSKYFSFFYKTLPYYLCLLLLVGCASTTQTQFRPVETRDVEQLLMRGKNRLVSKKKNSEVSLYLTFPRIKDGSKWNMWIELVNLSKKTAYIDEEKIKITRISDKKPLHVLSYEEIFKKVAVKNIWNALKIAVADITATSIIYTRHSVSRYVLRPTHIRGGESFSAVFATSLPRIKSKKEQFKIEVNFAGDIHTFQVEQEKQKRVRKKPLRLWK